VPAEGGRQDARRAATARVFFALWPPPQVARQLAATAEEFAKMASGRATRPETIHLTLAFLGDVALERLPELQRVAGGMRAAPFDLTLDRFGLWRHNRIFWAGSSVVPPALDELASTLAGALQSAGFRVADAGRTFSPHLTLVRKVKALDTALPDSEALLWPCRNFVLVRSTLLASGPSYQTRGEFPLNGEEVQA
jgi:RNA 2',3'-cyclic 3'-phosphodiesterase